jgi:flagellar biosynthesis protein FlhA
MAGPAGSTAGSAWPRIATGMQRLAGGSQDLFLAAGIGSIIAILVVPLPPILLDMGLAISVTLSVLILMTALFIEKPLQLSAFPTILLIATLLRLGLNIASTRLILSNGHEGPAAAGHVIEAFGRFLMGGNSAIGVTIFLILVIINFVVVTKGAGRIAEVAARFSLDAMPGKQMAIDADLSAGLIDEPTARSRRTDLESEANFFGAMDGASKFVRGDAVAGVMITGINIVVGFALGVIQHGLDAGQAFHTYTLLTVGDGLITQIPALIVSISAGLLVSKGGVVGRAEAAISEQLARFPKAIGAAAALLGMMALLPGLPFVPFATLAAVCGYAAWRLTRNAAATVRRGHADAALRSAAAVPDEPQKAIGIDVIRIELGYGLVPIVNDPVGEPRLDDQVRALRRHFAAELGFLMPPVRILDNMALKAGEYLIFVRETQVGSGDLRHDRLLAFSAAGDPVDMPGELSREPVFGLPALWIDRSLRDEARFRGLTVVDAAAIVTTHLTEVVKANLADLFGYTEAQALLASLTPEMAKLAADLVPGKLTLSTLQRVLQNLLIEGLSIRDIGLILEALAEASGWTSASGPLTEHVRIKLARQISNQMARGGAIPVITLSPEWELRLMESLVGDGLDRQLALAPSVLQTLLGLLRDCIDASAERGDPACLLVAPALRPALRLIVERVRPATAVLSNAEIHPRSRIRTTSVLGMAG